jgi:hypothetical protein
MFLQMVALQLIGNVFLQTVIPLLSFKCGRVVMKSIKILQVVLVQLGQQDLNMLMSMHSCVQIVKETAIQPVLFQIFLQHSMESNMLDYGSMLNNAVDAGVQMIRLTVHTLMHQQKQQLKQDLMLEFIQAKDLGETLLELVLL